MCKVTTAGIPAEEDDHVALRAAEGDHAAFALLVQRYRGHLLGMATRALRGDAASARDVVQQALWDLHRALPRYQARGRFKAFLCTLLWNRIRMRTRGVRREVLALEDCADLTCTSPRPDEGMLARQVKHALARALDKLPAEQRAVLVLRYTHDMDQQAVAVRLGVPVGTVKSRISAGLVRMRHHLQGMDA